MTKIAWITGSSTGIGRALQSLPTDRPRQLGVVGLGAGTLAVYGRPGDEMRMHEINDQVLDLARRHFSYLGDTPAQVVPVLGDGRRMLEREPPQGFDLLAMDAFSGDSIPTHLLTLEAFYAYRRHLAPEGWLAVHITNRYLDLRPVMAAAAQHLGAIGALAKVVPPFLSVALEGETTTVKFTLLSPQVVVHVP